MLRSCSNTEHTGSEAQGAPVHGHKCVPRKPRALLPNTCCRQEVSKQTLTFQDLPLRNTVAFTTRYKTVTSRRTSPSNTDDKAASPLVHSRSGCCWGQTWHLALSSHCRCYDVFTEKQFLPGVGHSQENGDLLLRWQLNFACYRQEHHSVHFSHYKTLA